MVMIPAQGDNVRVHDRFSINGQALSVFPVASAYCISTKASVRAYDVNTNTFLANPAIPHIDSEPDTSRRRRLRLIADLTGRSRLALMSPHSSVLQQRASRNIPWL